MIYNGVKTSYDVKMHFYMMPSFVRYYLVFSDEVSKLSPEDRQLSLEQQQQSISDESDLHSNQQQQQQAQLDIMNKLRSNEMYLSHGPKMCHISYSVLMYLLCANSSIDMEE